MPGKEISNTIAVSPSKHLTPNSYLSSIIYSKISPLDEITTVNSIFSGSKRTTL